jgi:hypothetical protein
MSDTVDQEIEAIKNVLAALTPLSPKARGSVLEYAMKRLDITPPSALSRNEEGGGDSAADSGAGSGGAGSVHIKDLKQAKKPRSANEMAALAAYYLANLAPEQERKKTVNQHDMETQFKIADYPLPKEIRVLLPNARAAGYFDAAGSGEYKLNAVGHNLVAHSMPRGPVTERKRRPSRKKPAASKKAKPSKRKKE